MAQARERLGLWLHTGDLRALEADIAAGRSVLLARLPDGVTKHLVKVSDVAAVAVVGGDGKCRTLLPPPTPRRAP